MNGNKKAPENIGFQTARLASFLKSWMSKFENCTGRATHRLAKSLRIAEVFAFGVEPSNLFEQRSGKSKKCPKGFANLCGLPF